MSGFGRFSREFWPSVLCTSRTLLSNKQIAGIFDSGKLVSHLGSLLSLDEARAAHEMLAGAPHKRTKVVLAKQKCNVEGCRNPRSS
jgi:hypothetical protein